MPEVVAILLAGGRGERLGSSLPKQFLSLASKPVLVYSLELFERCEDIQEIILVLPQTHLLFFETEIHSKFKFSKLKKVVAGGKSRQASTQKGLEQIVKADLVLVHDAARPLLDLDTLKGALRFAQKKGAVVVASQTTDTVKAVDGEKKILNTFPREKIYLAETPQIFSYLLLKEGVEKAMEDHFLGTDEASVVERLGKEIYVFESRQKNLKITTLEDLKMAEAFLCASV